ncbi:hypothetical protein JTB14_034872 [Gonioctena quinquepunctata]|nr:hypothetical protein JTB14_034872 [Gonioctena quinquepunctata]
MELLSHPPREYKLGSSEQIRKEELFSNCCDNKLYSIVTREFVSILSEQRLNVTRKTEVRIEISGMAETTEESTVKVRDLISVFESRANDPNQVEQKRPRAKSLGSILPKNVVVRTNELTSFEDLENALHKYEVDLKNYEVYEKKKHVELQTELFNVLTSIVNVRGDSQYNQERRKTLTAMTLGLVSSLNQKLPSNVSTLRNEYKYTRYDNIRDQEGDTEKQPEKVPLPEPTTLEKTQENEVTVSVKKLKILFQSPNQKGPDEKLSIEQNSNVPNRKEEYGMKNQIDLKNADVTDSGENDINRDNLETTDQTTESDDVPEPSGKSDLSVLKLRGLFEKNSKESSEGLQVILKEDIPQDIRFKYKVNIPYLEKIQEKNDLPRTVTDEAITENNHSKTENVNVSLNHTNGNIMPHESDGESDEDSQTESEISSSGSTSSIKTSRHFVKTLVITDSNE